MKKFWTVVVALVILFWITGCTTGATKPIPDDLEERAQNRKVCEDLGGEYKELRNGWTYDLTY